MSNLKGKNAILYRRVSTTDQKVYGNSLNAQKDQLRNFCEKNEIIIKLLKKNLTEKKYRKHQSFSRSKN